MTEFELKKTLGQEIEIPLGVEERIHQACAQVRPAPRAGRRTRRPLRTALVAAAMVAALSISAAAVYAVNHGPAFQMFFGNESRPSVEAQQEYDEYGRLSLNLPDTERVPVDEDLAENLVGDYLPDASYTWQIGEYTLTVEDYLLDEHTGTAKIYYILSRPGGVEGLTVFPQDGNVAVDGTGIGLPHFCVLQGEIGSYFDGSWMPLHENTYLDQSRSTEDTFYLVASLAGEGWSAADGLHVEFHDLRLKDESGQGLYVGLVETVELPAVESLPAVTVTDPETGEMAACFSAIGMVLDARHVEPGSYVKYVALEYADGTSYVVKDSVANVDNSEYGVYNLDNTQLRLCFNRLVDPERVVAVTVDGTTYSVKS